MKAVVLLSKTFFPQHYRAGEPTYFKQKVLAELMKKPSIKIELTAPNGSIIKERKKHTCRSNYEYWKNKIAKLQEKGGVLSVRQWIGQPYHQPGQEVIVDIPAEVVGVQKLELRRERKVTQVYETGKKEPITESITYDWTAEVDGWETPISLLAQNDGLTVEEFKAWFSPVFDKAEKKHKVLASISNATILDFAIIHFTKERY